jgi:hypothetical protein
MRTNKIKTLGNKKERRGWDSNPRLLKSPINQVEIIIAFLTSFSSHFQREL